MVYQGKEEKSAREEELSRQLKKNQKYEAKGGIKKKEKDRSEPVAGSRTKYVF